MSRLIVREHVVEKRVGQSSLRLEATLTAAASKFAAEFGGFRVPQVLGADPDSGTLTLERISPISSLAEINEQSIVLKLMEAAGRAIAAVHEHLVVPPDCFIASTHRVLNSGSIGIVHGDFNPSNVCVNTRTMELVILDWSSAPAYGPAFTMANQTLDVAHFARGIFLSHKSLDIDTRRRNWYAFLKGYESFGNGIQRDSMRKLIYFVVSRGLTKQLRQGRLVSGAMSVFRYRTFLHEALRDER